MTFTPASGASEDHALERGQGESSPHPDLDVAVLQTRFPQFCQFYEIRNMIDLPEENRIPAGKRRNDLNIPRCSKGSAAAERDGADGNEQGQQGESHMRSAEIRQVEHMSKGKVCSFAILG